MKGGYGENRSTADSPRKEEPMATAKRAKPAPKKAAAKPAKKAPVKKKK